MNIFSNSVQAARCVKWVPISHFLKVFLKQKLLTAYFDIILKRKKGLGVMKRILLIAHLSASWTPNTYFLGQNIFCKI